MGYVSLLAAATLIFHLLCKIYRKLFRVQATILQEDDKKVAVEDSFQPKSVCDDDGKGTPGESSESSSSSGSESWVIKLEQSINIFLTVSFLTFSFSKIPLAIWLLGVFLQFNYPRCVS